MTDLSQPAPAFNIEWQSEVIETRCFGRVMIRDIGVDAFEKLVMDTAPSNDTQAMMHALLCASATGPNGERFTPDILAHLPARAFHDRVELLKAAARINGVTTDDVEKA